MQWITSFFKVVTELEDKYILEINPMLIYSNLEEFKNKSNFSFILEEKINILKSDVASYDDKITSLSSFVKVIFFETKKQISNGSFKLIKFDYFYKFFYIKKSDFDENFILDKDTGSLKSNPNSLNLHGKNLNFLFWTEECTFNTPSITTFPKFNKITKAHLLDLENGLSILAISSTKGKPKEKVGIIFDAGNMFSKRVIYAKKIISFFKHNSIKKVICILSHEHMDHYNIFNLKDMGDWLRNIDSTAIYYEDIDIMSKLNFISNCKNKIPLKREDSIIDFGDIKIKTFFSKVPVPSHKQNKASMVLHSDGYTFTGDQDYENIEDSWIEKQKFFQVPHHGSNLSGNHKLAKNNNNALPSFVNLGLPAKNIKTYFSKNNKILKRY